MQINNFSQYSQNKNQNNLSFKSVKVRSAEILATDSKNGAKLVASLENTIDRIRPLTKGLRLEIGGVSDDILSTEIYFNRRHGGTSTKLYDYTRAQLEPGEHGENKYIGEITKVIADVRQKFEAKLAKDKAALKKARGANPDFDAQVGRLNKLNASKTVVIEDDKSATHIKEAIHPKDTAASGNKPLMVLA